MKRDLNNILKNININADWISLREVIEKESYRSAKNGIIDTNHITNDNGIMVEVIVDGVIAHAATNSLTQQDINKAAEKAANLAKRIKKYSLTSINHEDIRPAFSGQDRTNCTKELNQWSAGDYNNFLIELTNTLKNSNKVTAANATITTVLRETNYVSTSGANIQQQNSLIYTEYGLTVQQGGESQTRSTGHQVYQGGTEYFNIHYAKENCLRLSQEAHQLLEASHCPSETMDIIIDPGQMVLQIHESIGHPLELDRILGDEQNYAGKSFVKIKDFGKLQYGSPLLNITFDPTIDHELASYSFDDSGAKALKEFLIKDGKLIRPIGSLESQKRANLPGVACSRASSWNRAPIDRMANINLLPGNSSLSDMISQTERGIYVQTNRSWSIDDYRNKFQFGCEYGQLIENGKLTKIVKNPNYRGISTPFWNNLKAVGNSETTAIEGSYYCGKGEPNQLARVGHMSPTCLFKNIEVFGGV